VYFTLYEYLYPKIADFSAQDNAEVQKIGVFRTKFDKLFLELIDDGTWYDFDGSGTVTEQEKLPTRTNLVREGRENAFKVMNAMRTVSLCTNLGDVKTLVAHPASTSHGRLTEAQRQVAGIQQSLIRVAVGLENLEDLKADFLRGFQAL
jgi:hypothetical protein